MARSSTCSLYRTPRQALTTAAQAHTTRLAALALVGDAFVWEPSWSPLRQVQAAGVRPLSATAIVCTLASLIIADLAARRRPGAARTPALWLLLGAAGLTNAAFNWAVVIGDVVRVVLLFYLMPIWTCSWRASFSASG